MEIDFIKKILLWTFSGIGLLFIPTLYRKIVGIFNKFNRKEYIPNNIHFNVRKGTESDCLKISEMANFYLGNGRGVAVEKAKELINTSNEIYTIIECRPDGQIDWDFCGYFSLLPLTDSVAILLRNGTIQDYNLTEQSIYSGASSRGCELYIMDFMTNVHRCKEKSCCKSAGALLINALIKKVEKFLYINENVTNIFTIVASSNGQKIVSRFGFKQTPNYKSPYGWTLFEFGAESITQYLQKMAKKREVIKKSKGGKPQGGNV